MTAVPLLLLFLLLGCIPPFAVARQHIVLDVDGSVEDYASLTSIAQNPNLRSQLSLITVSGMTWGHAATLARNLCRFLSLAQLEAVTVSVGALTAAADEYDASVSRGGCGHSQGFPSTPHDALRRGMTYSRADVTNSFGAAYSLPPKSCKVEVSASQALYDMLAGMSAGDTVVYLALASSTNLASALRYLGRRDPASLQRFKRSAVVHFLEKGYSLAVDNTSTSYVLAEPGLRIVLYLPSFYDPAVTFSVSSWSELSTMAKARDISRAVKWLFGAWEAKKALVESRSNDAHTAFFREGGPASSLVTLCALDATVRASCTTYRTALSSVSLHLAQPTHAGAGTVQYRITGNNVTWPSYLLATPRDGLGATHYLVAQPADRFMPPAATSLASVFMSVWSDLLRS
ncbi:cell wall surface anchor family protein [Trypanosoma rangeli]|uniref:Cell wall surface anchor family protein n=1 Tax=Trypanosoma rangeli TaxID=5698 RepID=A0A422NFE0_TRYRA|nr:cell wall surface anchor family protein [Trypanosoma rangeli]RNF04159.1 cell wall surface anchor family protein [Trypanosoma rangeli]|eukprot:RNF04159.1 cell wall surface anchor family protein [Trypanosoma rangeli]